MNNIHKTAIIEDGAIIGDDVTSSDLQTNEQILNRIRKPNVC